MYKITLFIFLCSFHLNCKSHKVDQECKILEKIILNNNVTNFDITRWTNSLKESFEDSYKKCNLKDNEIINAKNEFLSIYKKYIPTNSSKKINFAKSRSQTINNIIELYTNYIRTISAFSGYKRDHDFEKCGIKIGYLPSSLCELFVNSIEKTKTIKFTNTIFLSDIYFESPLHSKFQENQINSGVTAYELGKDQLDILAKIISHIKDDITKCVGSPWRIVNMLCWKTRSITPKWGMYNWHKDGMPSHVRKVLIYLSGANRNEGSTEFILSNGKSYVINGPPGTWAYVKVSELSHRGIPPKFQNKERLVLELRIVPANDFDFRPIAVGYYSRYPLFPWGKIPEFVYSINCQ